MYVLLLGWLTACSKPKDQQTEGFMAINIGGIVDEFIVIAFSLLLSWILAISQNVFFIQEFVRRPRPDELSGELYQGKIYDGFRRLLAFTAQKKYTVVVAMIGLLLQ